MRCGKCGKNFDEGMYNGVCPKCGYFNNRQADYDVSKYFSATYDEGAKTSTNAQAAKQHEQLHRMYDAQNMHKTGAGSHEKLLGKPNPYQTSQPMVTGNKYQAGQSGVYGQNRTNAAGQTGAYDRNKYGKTTAYSEEKKKNWITPVCIAIAVLAIAGTAVGCHLKEQSMEEIYSTLEFERETAQAGEVFEVNGLLIIVDKAKAMDISALDGMPNDEKLVAVTVEILPADKSGNNGISGEVYVSDGSSYKLPLDVYTVMEFFYDGDYSMWNDIFFRYDLLSDIPADGKTGNFYFLVDKNAGDISITFDEGSEKDGIYALHRRVSVPLQLEEDGK